MEHSKGNWSVGKNYASVVTDNGEGFDTKTGHNHTEAYGGFLIAESIMKEADRKLISAAPDLLEALQEYLQAGHKEARRLASIKAKVAIKKATE